MLHNETQKLLVDDWNKTRNAKEVAECFSVYTSTVYHLGKRMRETGSNVSDVEQGIADIAMSTLKRICEKLPISSDSILFANTEKNDVQVLAERLEQLPAAQYAAVEAFINHVFEIFSCLGEHS